jgi:hypothetical protein
MMGDFVGSSGKSMDKCPTMLMKKSIPKSVVFLFITLLFYQNSKVMERKRKKII